MYNRLEILIKCVLCGCAHAGVINAYCLQRRPVLKLMPKILLIRWELKNPASMGMRCVSACLCVSDREGERRDSMCIAFEARPGHASFEAHTIVLWSIPSQLASLVSMSTIELRARLNWNAKMRNKQIELKRKEIINSECGETPRPRISSSTHISILNKRKRATSVYRNVCKSDWE